jgi:putative membrane protein
MSYLAFRTIAVLITSYLTRVGVALVLAPTTLWTAFLVAFSLAIINHTIKPIFTLVSIPITFATLGLFSFVINGAMILLAARIVPEFHIPSLLMAIYFSVVLAIVNWVLHIFE